MRFAIAGFWFVYLAAYGYLAGKVLQVALA